MASEQTPLSALAPKLAYSGKTPAWPDAAKVLANRRASAKCWIQDGPKEVATGAARPTGSSRIVSCVTSFATSMCVVIACVKVYVYWNYGQSPVVKTSALDSIGDLVANMITLYTGYRMARVDRSQFPIGQAKFEAIGVLVFSTLMAAMMLGNALGNVEDLLEVQEKEREAAVTEFWGAIFGKKHEVEGDTEWRDQEAGFQNLKTNLPPGVVANLPELLRTALKADDYDAALKAVGPAIEEVAEVENVDAKWSELSFQNSFLGCCAAYKFCLWLYVLLYAIPATGSTVLRALANDKRNDFIATSCVVGITFAAYFLSDTIDKYWEADKIDPLASLILSCVIIYTWVCLLREQVVLLSCGAVEPEVLEALNTRVSGCLRAGYSGDVTAYVSSKQHTVEVDLTVANPATPFREVGQQAGILKRELEQMEDVERAIVVPKTEAAPPLPSAPEV